jgi:hypothetical protein
VPDDLDIHLRLHPVVLVPALLCAFELIHTHVVLLIRVQLSGSPEGWRHRQPRAMAGRGRGDAQDLRR